MMVENTAEVNLRDSLAVKIPEPAVDLQQPWQDDQFGRKEVTTSLTNLVSSQRASLVVGSPVHNSTPPALRSKPECDSPADGRIPELRKP